MGDIIDSSRSMSALVVKFNPIEPPDEFSVWKHKRSYLLNSELQIWVHVNYKNYRSYYKNKWIFEDTSNYAIDHIMSRELAKRTGYEFIRLIHISGEANSSNGAGPEKEAVKYQESGYAPPPAKNVISYADPSDLTKMLDIKTGGFPLISVRDAMMMFYQ